MKEMPESDRNNQPMQINNYYGPVTIIQASDHSSINTESAKENKSSLWERIIKAIPILLGSLLAWFKGAG